MKELKGGTRLGECCTKTDWQVHALCLMGNHFHLVVETPKGNLVAGMKWMLGTYTARFNQRHKLCGHLFAGRYKALLVDAASPGYLRTVCEYVHLNPVRAKWLTPEQAFTAIELSPNPSITQIWWGERTREPEPSVGLAREDARPTDVGWVGKRGLNSTPAEQALRDFAWSSYPEYLKPPTRRWPWLRVERWQGEMRLPKDSTVGRREFERQMETRLDGSRLGGAASGRARQGAYCPAVEAGDNDDPSTCVLHSAPNRRTSRRLAHSPEGRPVTRTRTWRVPFAVNSRRCWPLKAFFCWSFNGVQTVPSAEPSRT